MGEKKNVCISCILYMYFVWGEKINLIISQLINVMIRNLSSSQNVLAHKESGLDLSNVVGFLFWPCLQNVLKGAVRNGG